MKGSTYCVSDVCFAVTFFFGEAANTVVAASDNATRATNRWFDFIFINL
jgi:hypothetical protein